MLLFKEGRLFRIIRKGLFEIEEQLFEIMEWLCEFEICFFKLLKNDDINLEMCLHMYRIKHNTEVPLNNACIFLKGQWFNFLGRYISNALHAFRIPFLTA